MVLDFAYESSTFELHGPAPTRPEQDKRAAARLAQCRLNRCTPFFPSLPPSPSAKGSACCPLEHDAQLALPLLPRAPCRERGALQVRGA